MVWAPVCSKPLVPLVILCVEPLSCEVQRVTAVGAGAASETELEVARGVVVEQVLGRRLYDPPGSHEFDEAERYI